MLAGPNSTATEVFNDLLVSYILSHCYSSLFSSVSALCFTSKYLVCRVRTLPARPSVLPRVVFTGGASALNSSLLDLRAVVFSTYSPTAICVPATHYHMMCCFSCQWPWGLLVAPSGTFEHAAVASCFPQPCLDLVEEPSGIIHEGNSGAVATCWDFYL